MSLGPFQVRWYGLMYVIGFSAAYMLVGQQIKKHNLKKLGTHFENLNFVLILSLIIGARLGYAFFYNFSHYIQNPLEVLAIWHGGMSFHGALIGVLTGGLLFCRIKGLDFWEVADIYVVTVPIGLGFGRLGNFINGELFGRVSDVPWAMIFPYGGPLPRHPSQLYECFLEGIVLFSLLWYIKEKKLPTGLMLAVFLLFYGIFRSFVELFRQPDPQLGLLIGGLTMGQLLSLAMIMAGIVIFMFKRRTAKI